MKNILPLLFAAALLPMVAQATSTSNVVGYVSLGNLGDVPADTDVRVSIPLLNPTEAVDAVATGGVAGNVITLETGGLVDDAWIGYYVQMTSGANEGQVVVVTDNDASTLTVMPQAGDSLTGVADGDTLALSAPWTVSTFMGVRPVGTQLLAFSGVGVGTNLASDVIYEYGNPFGLFPSDRWYDQTLLSDATDAVLYPGEGMIVRAGGTALTDLIVSGEVPTAQHRGIIAGGAAAQDTPMGYMSPVGEVVVDAGIPVTVGDQILLFDPTSTGINKAASTIYEYGNPFGLFPSDRWYNQTTLAELTTEELPGGQSFVYRTAGAASDVIWTDQQSYYGTL